MDADDNGLARSMAPLVGPLAPTRSGGMADTPSTSGRQFPTPLPVPALLLPAAATSLFSQEGPLVGLLRGAPGGGAPGGDGQAREALKFLFSPDGQFFRSV